MPSEAPPAPRRLHPLSLLFNLGAAARGLLLPGIVVLFFSGGSGFEIYLMPFFVFAAITAVVKYMTYRYRLGDEEMVVREGVLTRNERHIPYARIQNVNLVQNPFHRMLKVAEVHLETASGSKPEAIIRVLSLDAVEGIRERVFRERASGPGVEAAEGPSEPAAQRVLELPARELILLGLISNRGMAVIAAVMGILWQFDWWDFDWSDVADRAPKFAEGLGISAERSSLAGSIVLGVLVLLLGIVLMKVLSIIWALFRFYGFTLDRSGRDLRARYGLFTRYTAAIPSHRIQLLSSRTTPLHRWWGRSAVMAETAGGGAGNEGEEQRETHRLWLAPIIESGRLDDFTRLILPDVDLEEVAWHALPKRARMRVRNRGFFISSLVAIGTVYPLGWWSLLVLAVLFAWSTLHAAMWWKHAAWAVTGNAMAYRSGWWTRRASVVRFAKIQTVSVGESPFDRRHGMARLDVDTAGAGKAGHRLHIRYLPRATAEALHGQLAAEAAKRSFRW